MSDLYNTIPSERREAYLANAQAVFGEATAPVLEPAIKDMAHLIVEDATRFTRTHADEIESIHKDADELAAASRIGDEAERYAREHNMTERFRQELEASDAEGANLASEGVQLKSNPLRGDIGFGALLSGHQRRAEEYRNAGLHVTLAKKMQDHSSGPDQ